MTAMHITEIAAADMTTDVNGRSDRYDGRYDDDRYDNSRDRGGNSRPRDNGRTTISTVTARSARRSPIHETSQHGPESLC